jgi:queuine tRNA-ribosyltransferase
MERTEPKYGYEQALFPIVQGSVYKDLRTESAETIASYNAVGNAIGGLSVGEPEEELYEMTDHVCNILPKDKPRYVMGVGMPEDLLMIWENGVDMSDCIIPTKFARGGTLFTNRGKIRIEHKNYRRDFFPIEPNLKDYVNTNFTRAYIKHLFDSNEILGQILATAHNISFYKSLASRARQAILEDRYLEFKKEFLDGYKRD